MVGMFVINILFGFSCDNKMYFIILFIVFIFIYLINCRLKINKEKNIFIEYV